MGFTAMTTTSMRAATTAIMKPMTATTTTPAMATTAQSTPVTKMMQVTTTSQANQSHLRRKRNMSLGAASMARLYTYIVSDIIRATRSPQLGMV